MKYFKQFFVLYIFLCTFFIGVSITQFNTFNNQNPVTGNVIDKYIDTRFQKYYLIVRQDSAIFEILVHRNDYYNHNIKDDINLLFFGSRLFYVKDYTYDFYGYLFLFWVIASFAYIMMCFGFEYS